MNGEEWHYAVLAAFNEQHYARLLTEGHVISTRVAINVGTKETPDRQAFFILQKNKILYALHETHITKLPIVIDDVEKKFYGRKVYDIITKFRSAKFVPEKHFGFRFLTNSLAHFEHSSVVDFTLWKIMVLAASISRVVARVSSQPSFGKDSALKIVGSLLGDVTVVSNPTTAKLEYSLFNKIVALNEMANLTGEEKRAMEHFLLSTGDLSSTYEKRTRATESTSESYDISKLSLLIAFNDRDCYPSGAKYFDDVFQHATKQRFLPIKFKGQITQQIIAPRDVGAVAAEKAEFYKRFIRSMMWYRKHWFEEVASKDSWTVKHGADYGLKDRWAANFDTIRNFIILYSSNEKEAQQLLDVLYQRHEDYLTMVGLRAGAFSEFEVSPLEEIEERLGTGINGDDDG